LAQLRKGFGRPDVVLPTAATAVAGVVVLATGAPVAWLLLAACAAVALAVVIPAWGQGRWLEPLPLIAAVVLFRFVMRPLQLFLESKDLLSWTPPTSALSGLLRLDQQELALYATTKLQGALEPALTRTMLACTLFVALVVVGYHLPIARRPAQRLAGVGRRAASMDVRVVVILCGVLSACGQVAIVARTGGLSNVADTQLKQQALSAGLALHVLACFGIVGVLIWAAWRRPSTRLTWAAFLAMTLEICGFYALTGSRTRVLATALALIVIAHYVWRPLRARTVVLAVVLGLVFASGALAVRQATSTESFTSALGHAPRYLADPRVVLNDTTEFDQLFYATSTVGRRNGIDEKHGGWLLAAFHSYVPGFIDPNKPEPSDVVFRKEVWGGEVGAGRPPTVIGDFYLDFGFPGIAVGAILLGIAARALLGLLTTDSGPGRAYRVTLYALSLIVLHQLVIGTYSVALASVVTLVIPYLFAVHVFGRLSYGRLMALRRAPADARSRL
jgi:oligosaccharide repeat unit polymerase